jgi:hypothetical protein
MLVRQHTRNAACVLALAASVVLSACEVDSSTAKQNSEMASDHDLPNDRVSSSVHFRYHARTVDTAVCGDLLDTLEQHFTLLQSILGFEWPSGRVIDYYKFVDASDFTTYAPCPQGSSGCSFGGNVYTSDFFEQHELVHAYLWPVADPPVVITEGAAVALSCSHTLPQTPTLALSEAMQASDALSDPRVYQTGGRFVRYLFDRYGGEPFLRLYASFPRNGATADLGVLDTALRTIYGAGVDDLWLDMLVSQPSCAQPFACSRAALPIDGTPVQVQPICGLTKDARTFSITTDGNVAIAGPADAQVGSCSSPAASQAATTTVASGASQVGLLQVAAGQYFLSFDPRQPASVSVQAAQTPWAGAECATLEPYVVGAGEASGLTVTLPERDTVWHLRLRFDNTKQVSLSHHAVTADESVKATVCPSCDFYSNDCVVADLARDTLAVSWGGDYFVRFETLAAVAPNQIEIASR